MSRRNYGYTSLLKDDNFRQLNMLKVRRLIGYALAEFVGVATFMALGCSNTVAHIAGADSSHLLTAISFSFGIATAIIMTNHISGSVLNPALNLVAMILGHMSLPKLILYTVAQLLGSAVGVALIKAVTPDLPEGFCTLRPAFEISLMQAMTVEFVASCILTMVFISVADPRNEKATTSIWIKFGVVILAIAIPTAKYSGCGMNPARALGPALVMMSWTNHWIYWVCPYLAAIVVTPLYKAFFMVDLIREEEDKERNQP